MRESIENSHLAVAMLFLVILFLAFAVWYVFLPVGHSPVERTPTAAFEQRYTAANDSLAIRQIGGNELSGRITVWITDAETNTTETLVWHDSTNPPALNWDVPLIITDRDETGPSRVPAVTFDLGPGDHVRLQYEGPLLEGKDQTVTTTLGEFVVSNHSSQQAATVVDCSCLVPGGGRR